MKEKTKIIRENAVIINGYIYALIDDLKNDECLRCDLQEQCNEGEALICNVLFGDGRDKRFKLKGKIIGYAAE